MPIRYRTRNLCPDMATATARVAAGAAHLDALAGPDWHTLIDTTTLNIGDCRLCVLGQLARAGRPVLTSPFRGVSRGLTIGIGNELFNLIGLRPPIVWESYFRLNAAWVRLIQARRTAAEVGTPARRAEVATPAALAC